MGEEQTWEAPQAIPEHLWGNPPCPMPHLRRDMFKPLQFQPDMHAKYVLLRMKHAHHGFPDEKGRLHKLLELQ